MDNARRSARGETTLAHCGTTLACGANDLRAYDDLRANDLRGYDDRANDVRANDDLRGYDDRGGRSAARRVQRHDGYVALAPPVACVVALEDFNRPSVNSAMQPQKHICVKWMAVKLNV